MLSTNEVDRIVSDSLTRVLGDKLAYVQSRDSTDWEGLDALRVLVVLRGEPTGNEGSELLLKVQHDLQAAGETRFAYTRWLSEGDAAALESDGTLAGP